MSDKIRVLIVDDVATTRENIVKLMQFQPGIEAVGQAQNGEEAIFQAKALRPDVVLMDINMPGMDGITATERLTVEVPGTTIVIMSVQGEQEYLRRAMMAGAKNYLTKPFTGDELIQAIQQSVSRDRQIRDAMRQKSGVKTPGKIISVFAGKGGVGKTMLTVNLAVALAKRPETRVAIVDADIQFGDVPLFLNLMPRSTIADVLPDAEHLDDKTLAAYMTPYSETLHILAAPLRPEQAETVSISAISLFEIGQKVRLGKWPEMEPFLNRLIVLADEQGGRLVELSSEASLLAATLEWSHRDPFDRIIGATAITKGLTLISADTVFDSLIDTPKWPGRVW